ncbi:hypothetical protein N473_06945 [Pseudoalteromonas luteoviolacea CPMOR-1]|uniref:Uncharacterized protein n=1 Tax=Pseudoalteromonas luteoviolacea CPMOR-1 TaxID=1365248 RepID=A0A167H408_9GAMM|nr:hypothetical protein [Pseudoalteromonas luteoviolacea]KZN57608.1 hypothetical protein N473_06945 [Pseudoalteromonas luteoviolacea CPMOR-1]
MTTKTEFLKQYEGLIQKELSETLECINLQLSKDGGYLGELKFEQNVPYGVALHVMETIRSGLEMDGWTYSHNNKVLSNIFEVMVY